MEDEGMMKEWLRHKEEHRCTFRSVPERCLQTCGFSGGEAPLMLGWCVRGSRQASAAAAFPCRCGSESRVEMRKLMEEGQKMTNNHDADGKKSNVLTVNTTAARKEAWF